MDDPTLPPTPQTEAEYQAAFEQLLAEMRHLNPETAPDQAGRAHETAISALLAEMKEVRQELRALSQAVQQLQEQMRHEREVAARRHENLTLRLENYLLRAGQKPPSFGLGDEPFPPR